MQNLLAQLGLKAINEGAHDGVTALPCDGELVTSFAPATGEAIAAVRMARAQTYEAVTQAAVSGFEKWRTMPAPQRGEIVRRIGDVLRQHKEPLGRLVSLEMGKILTEGLGEVQEMIDICDFATGLSRQLCGSTMHSERPGHRMYEQWHPLGPVAVITAFNFPVAVWSWNSAIAAVCGNSTVWKPSHKTPLTAVAVQQLIAPVVRAADIPGVFSMVLGTNQEVGERMLADARYPLVSATGSCRMGARVSAVVSQRFGRTLLELGGNNAITVLADADMDLALRAILFGAVGTAGQRCTSTRRLLLEDAIYDTLVARLTKAYGSVRIGDPLEPTTLMGPLIDEDAVQTFEAAVAAAQKQGGKVLVGGRRIARKGFFVEPTLIAATKDMPICREETFAPILFIMRVKDLDEALAINNGVDQGLSSSIFTRNLQAAERFLSATGSDCGIANVNIGTSGAEIGGAFGGEKHTGGGREAGSDSWKVYMRRQTNTINFSTALPLSQGITFDI